MLNKAATIGFIFYIILLNSCSEKSAGATSTSAKYDDSGFSRFSDSRQEIPSLRISSIIT
jgi:hypothetical protein